MENSKENQIEEMTSDLENHTCMSQYQAEIASRMLYAKGYRKASEVAEEIFAEIEKLIARRMIPDVALIDDRLITDITELKKKYTQEK